VHNPDDADGVGETFDGDKTSFRIGDALHPPAEVDDALRGEDFSRSCQITEPRSKIQGLAAITTF
jgi:hypothetical protein